MSTFSCQFFRGRHFYSAPQNIFVKWKYCLVFHSQWMRLIFWARSEKWRLLFFLFSNYYLNIYGLFIFTFGIISTSTTSLLDVAVCFFLSRNYYFSGAITSNVNGFRIQNLHSSVFLFFRFPFTDTDDPQYSRGREGTILITPYDFHPLKNVQKNICSFPYEMTALYYQPQHM